MSVILAKRALPKSLGGAPPPEVAAALAQLPNSFGQLGLASGEASLNIKALRGQPGLYRLRVGDWRAVFVCTGQDFVVSAIGLRKDIYERVARMRLARKGEGVRIIELPAPAVAPSGARDRARARTAARAPKPVESNPLSVFSDGELGRIEGVDEALVELLRSLPRPWMSARRSRLGWLTPTWPSYSLTSGSGRVITSNCSQPAGRRATPISYSRRRSSPRV